MSDITNYDRAVWAGTAIEAFESVCRMGGETEVTKAKDLVTNICHFLRLECGLTHEQAVETVQNAVALAEIEMNEDDDG